MAAAVDAPQGTSAACQHPVGMGRPPLRCGWPAPPPGPLAPPPGLPQLSTVLTVRMGEDIGTPVLPSPLNTPSILLPSARTFRTGPVPAFAVSQPPPAPGVDPVLEPLSPAMRITASRWGGSPTMALTPTAGEDEVNRGLFHLPHRFFQPHIGARVLSTDAFITVTDPATVATVDAVPLRSGVPQARSAPSRRRSSPTPRGGLGGGERAVLGKKEGAERAGAMASLADAALASELASSSRPRRPVDRDLDGRWDRKKKRKLNPPKRPAPPPIPPPSAPPSGRESPPAELNAVPPPSSICFSSPLVLQEQEALQARLALSKSWWANRHLLVAAGLLLENEQGQSEGYSVLDSELKLLLTVLKIKAESFKRTLSNNGYLLLLVSAAEGYDPPRWLITPKGSRFGPKLYTH